MASADRSVVVTDCRFGNELAAVRGAGGELWRVERPGLNSGDMHRSEQEWRRVEVDRVIVNDGSLDDLHRQVIGMRKAA